MNVWWIVKELVSVVFDGGFWLTIKGLIGAILDIFSELKYSIKFYKYEMDAGDWIKEHDQGINESRSRVSGTQKHEKRY